MEIDLRHPPSTKYQAIALVLWSIAPNLGVTPPLTQLSRALRRADSFGHGVLRQLLDRQETPRAARAEPGVDFRPVLRWFIPDGVQRAARARQRFHELSRYPTSSIEAFEAFVCFHVFMTSGDAETRRSTVQSILEMIPDAPVGPGLQWPCALLQHVMTDFKMDLAAELADPSIAARYEPADHVYNLATGVEVSGAPPSVIADQLRRLRSSGAPPFVLAAYLLVVRLGALPCLAQSGRTYLRLLEQEHADLLRRIPSRACADYAARFDYGAELAAALRSRPEDTLDVLPLLEHALSRVARGELRRRRGTSTGGWTKQQVVLASGLFSAWGFGHECCRLLAASFDVRLDGSPPSQGADLMARFLMSSPVNEALGALVVDDLFPMPHCPRAA